MVSAAPSIQHKAGMTITAKAAPPASLLKSTATPKDNFKDVYAIKLPLQPLPPKKGCCAAVRRAFQQGRVDENSGNFGNGGLLVKVGKHCVVLHPWLPSPTMFPISD